MWNPSSLTWTEPAPLQWKHSLNHWTSREVSVNLLKLLTLNTAVTPHWVSSLPSAEAPKVEIGTAASGVQADLWHPGADEKVLGTTGIVKILGRP